ncbi:MAG TPA: patatin-like phospholipase family protein [Armatimonadota bacterium]|nr:patatin-like phospholipase family protein [Armatimonadota bacterium]
MPRLHHQIALWIVLLVSIIIVLPARADRPKIGIALGGGAARGFAHIGVLQWCEEHHIPIDCVAGTSFGGLVGGCYAMGMSPAEIQQTANSLDWDQVFSAEAPYTLKAFRRKEDECAYPGKGPDLGFRNGKARSRSGLFPGMPIDLLFDRITLPYTGIRSYDDLPIPFRCVAVDMDHSEQVVFHNEPLSLALRATMAIPGVFTPVHLNGATLADGGILNNLPADVVKSMGADVIIAVDVSEGVKSNNSFRDSLFGMVDQTVNVVVTDNTRRSSSMANIVIRPDLQKFSLMDWEKGADIAKMGYAAAEAAADQLLRYRVSDAEWQAYVTARQARVRTAIPVPQQITVTGASAHNSDVITKDLSNFAGKQLSVTALEHKLTALTGTGRYVGLSYQVMQKDADSVLQVNVQEKDYGSSYLRANLGVTGSSSTSAIFNTGLRLTMFDVGGYGSELRTDVGVGDRVSLFSEYYHPIKQSRWFVSPNVSYSWERQGVFAGQTRLAEFGVEQAGTVIDAGYALNNSSEIRLGCGVNGLSTEEETGSPDAVTNYSGAESFVRFRWAHDSTDDAVTPSRGWTSRCDALWYASSPGIDNSYVVANASVAHFTPVHSRLVIISRLAGGVSSSRDLPLYRQFSLGGPFRLGAYKQDELRGSRYVLGSVEGLMHLPKSSSSVFLALECGNAFTTFDTAQLKEAVTTGLVMKTAFGPLYVAGSLGESGRKELYFSVGRLMQ